MGNLFLNNLRTMSMPTEHWTATMLSLSMGMIALDRFYMGYVILGIIKAVTFGGFGGWAIYDAIAVSHCWLKDADGNVMVGCPEEAAQSLTEAVEDAGDDLEDEADDAAIF